MHRFFTSKKNVDNNKIVLTGDDVSHISKVLRLREGDRIIVSDSEECEYICGILSLDKKSVVCRIDEKNPFTSESRLKVHLYQGIPKAAKMDLIVQKCTELGIDAIIPVNTERVVVKQAEGKDNDNKIQRWRRIAEEAAKQSGRGRIPVIHDPISFDDALKDMGDYGMSIMPYEKEEGAGLKQILKDKNNIDSIAIFIGPEGGFSDDEVSSAREAGVFTATLGPRILRTETAGFTCLSIIMYELGDIGGI